MIPIKTKNKFEEALLLFMRKNVRGKDNYVYVHPSELNRIITELEERVYPGELDLMEVRMSYNDGEDSLWLYPDDADHDSWEVESVCRYVVYDSELNAYTLAKNLLT